MNEAHPYKPVRFFSAAILSTWAVWLGAAYFSYRDGSVAKAWQSALELAGLFGPSCAALGLVFISPDVGLCREFYAKLFDLRRIRPWTLSVIFLIVPAVVVASVALSRVFFGASWDQLRLSAALHEASGFIPLPVMFFGAALLEELGWKGYGIGSLRGKRTFLTATLLYAVLWALWHAPLFLIKDYYHYTLWRTNPWFAVNFFASILPAAVLINWLWYKNKGNILIAVLFHGAFNCQGLIQMGQPAKCLETGVLFLIAGLFVLLDKKTFLAPFPAAIGDFGRQGAAKNER
jgi:membrane protease YdiL (CAAX protease family)